MSRPDGAGSLDGLEVSLDYASFRGAYGGDWAARLRLVQLPGCALTTPGKAECQRRRPLVDHNDTEKRRVSAKLGKTASTGAGTLRAMSGDGGTTVLALTAGSEGSSGDYKASPLQASGSWSAGGSTGALSWNYPIAVPAVPGGLEPGVALGYNSQSVDGRTAASNNQPSWLGDGWAYEPGFIERRCVSCEDDKTDGTNTAKEFDQCWYSDNATLSLGGKATELVHDPVKGWHPEVDSGEKVEKLTGAQNGDDDGEHRKITTTDGTQYFFGLNRLPGWSDHGNADDDPVTESTWTVPVFGNQSGEPCHRPSVADGWCPQAWRWQLDYVVDVHGNAMAYYWKTERNNYARAYDASTGKGTPTSYVRGGWQDRPVRRSARCPADHVMAQAEEYAAYYQGNPNVRVIYPAGDFDSRRLAPPVRKGMAKPGPPMKGPKVRVVPLLGPIVTTVQAPGYVMDYGWKRGDAGHGRRHHPGVSSAARAVGPRQHTGDGVREGLPPRARERHLHQPPVVQHPQPETVVILVPEQDLHRPGVGPRQRLQVRQESAPVAADELDDPGIALVRRHRLPGEDVVADLREALVPLPVLVAPGERLHHLLGSTCQNDDLGVSAHAIKYPARPRPWDPALGLDLGPGPAAATKREERSVSSSMSTPGGKGRWRRVMCPATVVAVAVALCSAGAIVPPTASAALPSVAVTGDDGRVSPEDKALNEAKASGNPVELVTARTELSDTWVNPDGTFTAKRFGTVVRVLCDGGWVPTDPTLEFAADGSVRPRATSVAVSFSGGGTGPILTGVKDGRTL
ncbi:hypothetical protein [Streptomyces sp. NPDC051909]|uniref:hypothetical protein n=1 Tax=Streptomyces sp. NPDC051909 TaxID=3154944 RepID=UPI00342A99BC